MSKELHRHDISDSAWKKVKPHTIGEKSTYIFEHCQCCIYGCDFYKR